MASQLAEAHVEAERRLQNAVTAALVRIWEDLPGYDEGDDVDAWLAIVVPLILASQRQSAVLTNAYLARALERQPLAIDVEQLIGEAVRGVTLQEVYRRPFVTLWSELGEGKPFEDASKHAVQRAQSQAAWDVQATMRDTLVAVGEADETIWGFQRVANPDACTFCLMVNGAQFRKTDPLPLHPWCRCSVEPVVYTRGVDNANALDAFNANPTPVPEGVAVHAHGEMGPTLGSSDHDFTTEGDLALA